MPAVRLPGLTDIHTHGCIGFDFASASCEEMAKMSEYYLKNGITSVLPTLTAMPPDDYKRQIEALLPLIEDESCPFFGINLEGPFLSKSKKGAINGDYLRPIDLEEVKYLWSISKGTIKIMTVSPSLDGFNELCDFAHDKFVISLGHTDCDSQEAQRAFQVGASHVTHLFNAMNPMHHRAPGLICASLNESCTKEIICDGVHLDKDIVKMLFRGFHRELVLISDSMSAAGLHDGEYILSCQPVFVKNGRALLSDGTIAGSCSNLFDGFKNVLSWGIPLSQAAACASLLPLRAVKEGRKDDFIELSEDLKILSVVKNGVKRYCTK